MGKRRKESPMAKVLRESVKNIDMVKEQIEEEKMLGIYEERVKKLRKLF